MAPIDVASVHLAPIDVAFVHLAAIDVAFVHLAPIDVAFVHLAPIDVVFVHLAAIDVAFVHLAATGVAFVHPAAIDIFGMASCVATPSPHSDNSLCWQHNKTVTLMVTGVSPSIIIFKVGWIRFDTSLGIFIYIFRSILEYVILTGV